jgi:type IV pilus assembly protein PilQ
MLRRSTPKILHSLLIIGSMFNLVFAQRIAPQQEGKRYGEPGFRGEPISLNVVNADIRDILNYISEQYGVNFVIDKSVKSVPVTVNITDVPWNIALDAILQSQDLGAQVNGPIVRIAERKTLADEAAVEAKIRESRLDTSPLFTEFIRLNYACGGGACGSQTGFKGGVVGGGGSDGGGGDQGILGIIKKRLSRRGSIEVDGRTNTLIITDVKENIDAIRQLVALLDQPEPQVEIEARIVAANRNFSRDLGVQLAAALLTEQKRGGGGVLSTIGDAGGTGGTGGNLVVLVVLVVLVEPVALVGLELED